MASIAKQTKTERDALSLRLDRDVNLTLKQYGEFIHSSQDHVINEALRYFFKRDKEFAAWQKNHSQVMDSRADDKSTTDPGPEGKGTKQQAAKSA